MFTRLREIRTIKNPDILFVGSSHTYRGFDTRIFDSLGIRSFNLGSSSQTPVQTQVLLYKYLETINPKIVLYEVNPSEFSSDGVESSLDLIANDTISNATVDMALKIQSVKTWNTLVYSFIRQALKLDKDFKEKLEKDDDTYIKGGYVEKKLSYYQPKVLPIQNEKLNELQLNAFNETIHYLNEKHIKLILIQAPVTKTLYKSYSSINQFDSIMLSKNLPYYNYNKLMNLEDSKDFYDEQHLNKFGVKKFNLDLIDRMKSLEFN